MTLNHHHTVAFPIKTMCIYSNKYNNNMVQKSIYVADGSISACEEDPYTINIYAHQFL